MVASNYSIAGPTYESGCSASNTEERLTADPKSNLAQLAEIPVPLISVGKEIFKDIEICYTDWGSGPPVVFSHRYSRYLFAKARQKISRSISASYSGLP